MSGRISVENVLIYRIILSLPKTNMAAWYVNIVYSVRYNNIYGAHTCLSGPYKYSLRFSESGRILKQSIKQIKFTWSVNYVG